MVKISVKTVFRILPKTDKYMWLIYNNIDCLYFSENNFLSGFRGLGKQEIICQKNKKLELFGD